MITGVKFFLNKIWYQKKIPIFLRPFILLSFLYDFLMQIRFKLYKAGIFKVYSNPQQIPVIVVGNFTVGGTGKTPCVIHIAQLLKERGFRPGIVSRGYKSQKRQCKRTSNVIGLNIDPANLSLTDVNDVGDEPFLMAKRLACPVVVSRYRAQAVQMLAHSNQVDVIIADDGLHHYSMARDIEIVLIDGLRRFGNGYCLPVGPLRESVSKLPKTDFTIVNLTEGGICHAEEYDMDYYLSDKLESLLSKKVTSDVSLPHSEVLTLSTLQSSNIMVHAVAGLAHPERFFNSLEKLGIRFIPHAFPDHHAYIEQNLQFSDDFPILMTEKDAVKCMQFKNSDLSKKIWVVQMKAHINPLFDAKLLLLLKEKIHG